MIRPIFLALFIAPIVQPSVYAAEPAAQLATDSPLEMHERNIDRAAIQSQKQAIAQLEKLTKKYRGQSQEPTLLLKLAELYQELSSMEFRVSAFSGFKDGKKQPAMNFPSLQKAVSTLRELIAKFPNHPEADRAYFLRGKSLEELGQKSAAAQDYIKTVMSYPDSAFVAPSYMSLAEFAIEDNQHEKAVGYLEKVEGMKSDPRYPFALYKLAWSHFNLKNVAQSLKYIEKHIRFYQEKNPEHKSQSDIALLENSLQDLPTFYFEGYEKGMSTYGISDAYDRFKEIEQGPAFGKMLLKFAKLLRSHSHEKDLFAWQKEIFEREPKRPETIGVITVAFEYAINRKLYEQWPDFSKSIVQLSRYHQNSPALDQARKLILETAESLQPQIIKNKDAGDIGKYSTVLAGLYESYIQTLTTETDPRVGRVHYNLGETFFAIKEYAKATQHYRWTVENMPAEHRLDAELKALSSRYQELVTLKLIPNELKAVSMSENTEDKLPENLGTWLQWVDQAGKNLRSADASTKETLAKFYLEASRALYGQKHLKEALVRMKGFIDADPAQESAIAMATLTLDTWIISQDWPQTERQAQAYLGVKAWKSVEFTKKLNEILVDAKYKQLEGRFTAWAQAGTTEDSRSVLNDLLDDVADFAKKHAESPRKVDLMVLAGNASLKAGERKRALGFYNSLLADNSGGSEQAQSQALIARAALEEEAYLFEKSAQDYLAIFKKSSDGGAKSELIKKKILQLAWLSGSVALQKQAFENPKICPKDVDGAMKLDCQHAEAMIAFQTGSQSAEWKNAFEKARKIAGPAKSIWATVALRANSVLPYRDRNLMIRLISMGWKELDPLTQYVISSEVMKAVPLAFQFNKDAIGTVAPLRATEKHIIHRIDVIKELENAATAAMGLPWIEIRTSVLTSMSEIYTGFSQEIRAMKVDEGMTAEELAVYKETVEKISEPFGVKGKDLAKQAEELAKMPRLSAKINWTPALFAKLDPEANWNVAQRQVAAQAADLPDLSDEQRPQALRGLWSHAFTRNDLAVMGFVLQEAQERKVFTPKTMGIVRAASLARIGALAEAAAEEAIPDSVVPQEVALTTSAE